MLRVNMPFQIHFNFIIGDDLNYSFPIVQSPLCRCNLYELNKKLF